MATSSPKTVERLLLCRVGAKRCGLPLTRVVETMRPLPIEPFARLPAGVDGVAVIRGVATPVVDARKLLGADCTAAAGRFVTLALGSTREDRVAALAVDEVLGVQAIATDRLSQLPGLLGDEQAGLLQALGTLDQDLLVVLTHGRLVPEAVWQELAQEPLA